MAGFDDSGRLAMPRAPGVPFKEASREQPSYIGPAIGAVLGLSLGAGVLAFVGLGLVCWGAGWPAAVALIGSGSAVLVVGVVWILDAKSIMFATESITGVDLDGDGAVGAPAVPVVRVEVHEPDKGRWVMLDLPGTPESIAQLGRGLLLGRSFSEAEWCGRGRPFSKPEFVALRAQLVERGIVRWRDERSPAQGCELTHAGRAVFRAFVESPDIARTHARALTDGQFAAPGELGQGGEYDD